MHGKSVWRKSSRRFHVERQITTLVRTEKNETINSRERNTFNLLNLLTRSPDQSVECIAYNSLSLFFIANPTAAGK